VFLFQKLNVSRVSIEEFEFMFKPFDGDRLQYDSETTGLDTEVDTAFLLGMSWKGIACEFEPTPYTMGIFFNVARKATYVFAHNAKFDYKILANTGYPIPEDIYLCDSMTVARLTTHADDDDDSISLESLGTKYVDPEAKFAGKVIRTHINSINKTRLTELRKYLKAQGVKNTTNVIDAYQDQVQFVDSPFQDWFPKIKERYRKPNYFDSYQESPELMKCYIIDDVVILEQYLNKAFPVLLETDKDLKIFKQECKLIRVVADLERHGLRTDINYLLESRLRVKEYANKLYEGLWLKTGKVFSSGQHQVIMDIFADKYAIRLSNCDIKALSTIKSYGNAEATSVAEDIVELRTLDKWLSTYIEGMLNRVRLAKDGTLRVHTSINNSGTVTGRVSSDMQQQPKEPLLGRDGVELFHPRRATICDTGSKLYFFDYSQMELRVQAHYTVLLAGGDKNLCRAFMPFQCTSFLTGEDYSIDTCDWKSGEWMTEDGEIWTPTDLHATTTMKAFPGMTPEHQEWKHFRRLGKMCNFLKNYGGGIGAIQEQLGVPPDIAEALNRGYYEAFPKILTYQKWVEDQITIYGFVTNIYGRRYYLKSNRNAYKGYNYLIQGGCADIVKDKEIRVFELLKDKKSRMILPVHDELILDIDDNEEYLVEQVAEIMNDCKGYIDTIPMVCEIEVSTTNWADKKEI